ncbi:hypothetical protein F4813DRAFT_246558 [Daldinia decipiens]|uniref:uncharacterized protein n=1 Tax=Daldinia decipiens TaxID=326647 RepID=UPI0020C570ED|nr:uncharacterized protein F4813DRAFT_246558 [Daldinia decipiens]KAI1653810.1 hypothetical protein F4813DRAFT_246558 [Daldinia decipiens]
MSIPLPSTSSFYSANAPMASLWPAGKGAAENPQHTGVSCQFITFYHTCGCRSNKDSVYLCSTDACQHTKSTVLLGELPFACGSYPGRSAVCSVEDPAKREFVREVDTADRLDKLLVLPDCTKADIDILIPRFQHPNWHEHIYRHYQQMRTQSSIISRPQLSPSNDRDVKKRDVNIEEVVQRLLYKYKVQEEEYREDMVERFVEEQQQRQLNYQPSEDTSIYQEENTRLNTPSVSSHRGSVDYTKSLENDDLDNAIYYDEIADAVMFNFEDDTGGSVYGLEISYANHSAAVESAEDMYYEEHPQSSYYQDIAPDLETPNTPRYCDDGFSGADDITDDFIDFLAEKEKEKEEEKKKEEEEEKRLQGGSPVMRKIWSYFRGSS